MFAAYTSGIERNAQIDKCIIFVTGGRGTSYDGSGEEAMDSFRVCAGFGGGSGAYDVVWVGHTCKSDGVG